MGGPSPRWTDLPLVPVRQRESPHTGLPRRTGNRGPRHHGWRHGPPLLGDAEPGDSTQMPVAKAELLYLSPVIPALTGNGLAMRAGMVLEALARHYTVTLLVVTRYPPYEDRVLDRFEKLCRRAAVVPLFGMTARTSVRLWRPWRHRSVVPGPDELWKEFGNLQFDVIHVF